MPIRLLLLLGSTLLACPALGETPPPQLEPRQLTPAAAGDAWLDIHAADDGRLALTTAVRRLDPPRAGMPVIWLAAAVHIGEPGYYDQLQRFLDRCDLVLYEGVGRPPFMERGEADDATAAWRSITAAAFVAEMLSWHRKQFGQLPADLERLRAAVAEHRPRDARPMREALLDGWQRPLAYRPENLRAIVGSLGADGAAGGSGFAADRFAPLPNAEADGEAIDSVQVGLAESLGLAFQLDAINYDQAHFLNSDMTLRELTGGFRGTPPDLTAVAEQGAPDSARRNGPPQQVDPDTAQIEGLLSAMEGRGLLGGVLKVAINLIGRSPQLQSLVRVAMIELLGQVRGDISEMPGLPPALQQMMRTLIQDRNRIVVRDATEQIRQQDPPQNLAIFYGAGHMHDLEQRLIEKLGYRSAAQFTLPAFEVDPRTTGLSEQQIQVVRGVLRFQLMVMKGGALGGEAESR